MALSILSTLGTQTQNQLGKYNKLSRSPHLPHPLRGLASHFPGPAWSFCFQLGYFRPLGSLGVSWKTIQTPGGLLQTGLTFS